MYILLDSPVCILFPFESQQSLQKMSNHPPSGPKWLNKQYLEDLVTSYIDEKFHLKEYEITPGSNFGDNYVCQILRIKLSVSKNGKITDIFLIGKHTADTVVVQMASKENFNMHETEVYFLAKILPILNKYYPDKRIGPKCYHADDEQRIIFMEDLKQQGFLLVPRESFLDIYHCFKTVRAHATLHAASYLELQKNLKLVDKFRKSMWRRDLPQFMDKFIVSTLKNIRDKSKLWNLTEKQDNLVSTMQQRIKEEGLAVCDFNPDYFNILTHGDCWKNNMMFKYENDEVVDVCLLDFQLVCYNCFALDLQYFLSSSSMHEVRYEKIDDILEFYYNRFIEIAPNVKDFSLKRVKKEFKDKSFFGLAMAILMRPIVVAKKGVDVEAFADEREFNIYEDDNLANEVKKALNYFCDKI